MSLTDSIGDDLRAMAEGVATAQQGIAGVDPESGPSSLPPRPTLLLLVLPEGFLELVFQDDDPAGGRIDPGQENTGQG
ncbi:MULTISPECIES: hypothetical protein [unclassified Micromonospora]|uniref:hypothetical protein n=1 Tax=unclassified Micromonospora TaxID=2617518 RepID=UPI0036279AA0